MKSKAFSLKKKRARRLAPAAARVGVIGLGKMGLAHARQIAAGQVAGLSLAAVCDVDPATLAEFRQARPFTSAAAMFASGELDAVVIATPHYSHTALGIEALRAGLHVLVEKPISVHAADARRLLAAHHGRRQVFAAMFNQRTDPYYRRIHSLIRSGALGRIQRVNWIITTWFRPDVYYASGGWRATWAGEGGGVLLNQAPHNLDLLCWLFGPPRRVRAHCHFGKYHRIEVEDEVTAWCEFPGGATGVFITSTGEAPGTNRLEITADRGRLVYENDRIEFTRTLESVARFRQRTREMFGTPRTASRVFTAPDHGGQHKEILANFAAAILRGAPLIAPARDGLHSVELANAMILSTWLDRTIELPLDAKLYARLLRARIGAAKKRAP